LTKTLSGGGGVYALRLSEASRRSGVGSRVLCLDDGSLLLPKGLSGRVNGRLDWALSGAINRRSRRTMLSFQRRQIWTPEVEIGPNDIVHLHSITGFIGERGLRHLLRNRPRVFWTAHNPWLFTGGCVAYAGCDRFETGCKRCPLLKFPLGRWSRREFLAKARFWREFDVRPIANSEWMAAMMRRSPLFEGMEIPVVPPIVDEVFTAKAESGNYRAEAQRRWDSFGNQENHETKRNEEAGLRLGSRAGASESDSLASELADSPVSESLTRSASIPASSLDTSHSLPFTAPGVPKARRFVVGIAARSLTDQGKGIQEFFARLPVGRTFVKETTFVLIGDGRIRVPVGVDCRFLGHIDSPGRLAEIYRSLDLFVSASAMETFGMAILEAQACGTPVVAFETGGTPEAVCPEESRLVPNGNFKDLFRSVEEMFYTARGEGGQNQKLAEWVSARHSWEVIIRKHLGLYWKNDIPCD
jgi:glycosyltransferase involved in cell wall biosynthesis